MTFIPVKKENPGHFINVKFSPEWYTRISNAAGYFKLSRKEIVKQSVEYALSEADTKYRIWSIEHKSWWRANSNGYTTEVAEAGIYSRFEAIDIIQCANAYHNVPNEALIPVIGEKK